MAKHNLLEGKRILIVDDEPDVLDTLGELLTDFEVGKAASFDEAEEKMKAGEFDIAVLDIMGVDGYKLLEIAIELNIVAVMLTANALSPEDTIKSHREGAAYYLPKEEMANIEQHLSDVLEALEKGKNTWARWVDRFASFYEEKFGPDWQDENKDYWDKFKGYY